MWEYFYVWSWWNFFLKLWELLTDCPLVIKRLYFAQGIWLSESWYMPNISEIGDDMLICYLGLSREQKREQTSWFSQPVSLFFEQVIHFLFLYGKVSKYGIHLDVNIFLMSELKGSILRTMVKLADIFFNICLKLILWT